MNSELCALFEAQGSIILENIAESSLVERESAAAFAFAGVRTWRDLHRAATRCRRRATPGRVQLQSRRRRSVTCHRGAPLHRIFGLIFYLNGPVTSLPTSPCPPPPSPGNY